MKRVLWWVPLLALTVLACNGLTVLGLATPSPRPLPTIAPITPTPAATPTAAPVHLAWANTTSLNITDLQSGRVAQNHQYELSGTDGVGDLAWSPQGDHLAYASGGTDPQLYALTVPGGSAPIPLGPGFAPAWSPDGNHLLLERDGNLWLLDLTTQASQQLTVESHWQWGNAVFAPDGQSVIVAGAPTDEMGAQGNVLFYLYSVPLDGSGALRQLPALESGSFFGRLPYDLQLSPDGQHLAFSTSAHLNACASPTAYYVGDVNGTNWQEAASATVNAALDSAKEIYQEGQGLTWLPDSTAVVLDSFAWDCSSGSPTQTSGPLLSIVGLDGAERTSWPIDLANLSVDKSGQWLAGLAYPPDGSPAHIKVYSLANGQPLIDLGEGLAVKFGP